MRRGPLAPLALLFIVGLVVSGCAETMYKFQPHEVRGATKFLNRAAAAAQPQVEEVCSPTPAQLKQFCRALRNLYKGAIGLADGIDDALNAADKAGTKDVDIAKLLDAGFKILDLVTEEEAIARERMASLSGK